MKGLIHLKLKLSPLAVAISAMFAASAMAVCADPAATAPTAAPAAAASMPPPPPPPSRAPATAPDQAAPDAPQAAPPGVAATVDGEDIMADAVKDWAYDSRGSVVDAVNTLIDFKLIDDAASAQHVTVTDADLAAKKDEIRNQIKPITLEQALAEKHMTMEFLDANLRHAIEAEKLAGGDVKPIEMYHIRHILIMVASPGGPTGDKGHTEAQAKVLIAKVQAQLKAGKSFDELAKQYSEDPSNKDKGGDLGIVNQQTQFDPDFLKAALTLKAGQITPQPVKSAFGYHLIECVSTSDSHPKDEDDAYAKEADTYREGAIQQRVGAYVQSLHGKAKIVNYLTQ